MDKIQVTTERKNFDERGITEYQYRIIQSRKKGETFEQITDKCFFLLRKQITDNCTCPFAGQATSLSLKYINLIIKRRKK